MSIVEPNTPKTSWIAESVISYVLVDELGSFFVDELGGNLVDGSSTVAG